MSLTLLQNATAMAAYGLTTYFQGSGGTAPYTYSVQPGGVGGSINSSSGLYTSPSSTGVDTIEVTDSASNTALATILVGTPLELFCDVIETYMGLSQGQVYLWDQKINIPTDSRLYVAVGVISCKPFGNSNTMDSNGNSIQSVNMQALLSVDILSRGPSARDQKEQIILALESNYAQSQQELNSFYIGKLPTGFVNLSQEDGAAIPYRFNISVAIQYFVPSKEGIPYFNSFGTPEIYTNS